MRTIEYQLYPEAFGANDRFESKKGTVAELIFDMGMFQGDKVIIRLPELNKVLMHGSWPRSGDWEPFELTNEEYDEVVEQLINLPLARPFRRNDGT